MLSSIEKCGPLSSEWIIYDNDIQQQSLRDNQTKKSSVKQQWKISYCIFQFKILTEFSVMLQHKKNWVKTNLW